jgi:hypothetical protein
MTVLGWIVLFVILFICDATNPRNNGNRGHSPPYDSDGNYDPELARQINEPPYANDSSDDDHYRNENEIYTDIFTSTWDD